MSTRTVAILRAALAVWLGALACAGCAQGGGSGDGSSGAAVPTGNVTAYGTIDEGIVIKR
jgi:hypothetical protein